MTKQVRIYIIGDVIGVGFRAWTKIMAKKYDIHGWVRNNYERREIFGVSGGVEAVLQGNEQNVIEMVDKLKEGSPISRVENVDVMIEEVKELFDTFEIRK